MRRANSPGGFDNFNILYSISGGGSPGTATIGKPVRFRCSHLCCRADEETKVIGEIREDVSEVEAKPENLPLEGYFRDEEHRVPC